MSANSDTRQLLDMAERYGFTVEKTKHGGYAIKAGGRVVCRVPVGRGAPKFAVKNARRAIERDAR